MNEKFESVLNELAKTMALPDIAGFMKSGQLKINNRLVKIEETPRHDHLINVLLSVELIQPRSGLTAKKFRKLVCLNEQLAQDLQGCIAINENSGKFIFLCHVIDIQNAQNLLEYINIIFPTIDPIFENLIR